VLVPNQDIFMLKRVASFALLLGVSLVANAVPVTYIGSDNNVSSLSQMVNSQAAAANFTSIAGSLGIYDFESAVPANLMINGGATSTDSGCGVLCGFNTSTGGAAFRSLYGGQVTFTFTNPVDAFGFYVNGLQTDRVSQQTIVYADGTGAQTVINFPTAIGGGGAFVGFIDFGKLISSVTFNASNDILGFDDLRFGRAASDPNKDVRVPEPTSLALFGFGLMGLGLMRRRR
jgi:PEP-CTERM motif